ncbi:ribbon-helix-helix protein, CopG family [Sphingosinicella soli]|uniref:Metal-responsive CopG/Arc/MetJ family transcriptional regulator n=1 Tax=Sphingosinicella soli TaxID=333708 RepID=A0A7W7AZW8_9SPHN|nr:ribbon-helix-helix protein, CopG family [Sphingosinicella soli]MBB4630528.1 metal-responsive CopG/Arc/MetJ family transcriptional regulator [Sphingosinicella soli]
MRTIIDIAEPQMKELDTLSRQERQSRAALIRKAIAEYLARHRQSGAGEAFGLWGDRKIDGLDYQERARSEW